MPAVYYPAMTIAYWMVLVAAVLPYVFVMYAKATPAFMQNDYNKNPREYATTLSGPRQRAYWAHQNGFEAFPAFAAAVIIAVIAGVPAARVNLLAELFIGCRVAHGILYIANQDKLRTLVWLGGLGCVGTLFVSGATAG